MIEVNQGFVAERPGIKLGSKIVMVTPPIDENFFIARVVLYKDQAINIFPKFGVIGCGFAIEEDDWNTNLPLGIDAEQIYDHIKGNKKYAEITRKQCVDAIKELQDWCRERKLI